MPTYSATGITLLVHKYRGTDRLAVFYTRERGKVEATVRGVGKPGSKLAAAVEPLALSRMQFAEGRNLDRLTQAEVVNSFYDLRMDLQRLARASWAAELVSQTTEPGHPDPDVFDALAMTLSALSTTPDPDLVVWAFALRYLCGHGVGPILDHCAACEGDLSAVGHYAAGVGGCVCRDCGSALSGGVPVSGGARGAMDALARMTPDRVQRLRLDARTRDEIRQVIQRHVRYHMGVELKTERFLQKMARAGGRAG